VKILDVTADNVDDLGFFCSMSKRKSEGHRRKLEWVRRRFREGMKIKLLELPDRGFIEFIPGEHAWRTIDASGYIVIHCLWVVGKSKNRGIGSALLDACLEEARAEGARGVAILTSERNWLVGRRFFENRGFEVVGEARPAFSLMVKGFGNHPPPQLIDNRRTIRERFPEGLTVFCSDQCPYIEGAVRKSLNAADRAGVQSRVVELERAEDVRRLSPSPYGTFGLVLNGELISYHYLLEKDLLPILAG
jgi:GNAT superfamily N-acetyltransferase